MHCSLVMAVRCLVPFGLCLICAISAQAIDRSCSNEECTSVAADPAAGPSLLQARKTRKTRAEKNRRANSTRHSKRSSKRREAGDDHDDGHGDWGGCADTNGDAVFTDSDGYDTGCEFYEGEEWQHYCDEDKDDDFRPREMCCSCGGGGPVPDPHGLSLANRVEACKKRNGEPKEVGQKCKIFDHVPDSNDMTHLQSQCGADHDEDGNVVLACIPAYKLKECCHTEDTCKGATDGTLCG